MKLFIMMLLIIFGGFSGCYAQAGGKIEVPTLKADKRVDSLMDIIFKIKRQQKVSKDKFLADSSWMIFMIKFKGFVSFGLAEKSNSVINGLINKLTYYKANIGCFEYKQNRVFVWTKDDFNGFFEKMPDTKAFDFIYKLHFYKEPAEEQSVNWHYKYENGHFSIEGPPAVY